MTRATKNIVLIHGLWMTPRSWEAFWRFFEGRGYRVSGSAWPRLQGNVEDIRRHPDRFRVGLVGLAGLAVKVKMHGWPVLPIAFLPSFLTFLAVFPFLTSFPTFLFLAVFLLPLPPPWLLRRSLTLRNVFLA